MAEAPAPEASNPLIYLFAFLVIVFIIWLYTGGPSRYEAAHPEVPLPTPAEIGN